MIYLFSDPAMGGTVSGNTLTLDYNTTTMADSDKLQIFYDSADTPATDTTAQAMVDMVALLKRIAEYTSVLDVTDSANRQRISVDGMSGYVPTTMVGSGGSVGNIALAVVPGLTTSSPSFVPLAAGSVSGGGGSSVWNANLSSATLASLYGPGGIMENCAGFNLSAAVNASGISNTSMWAVPDVWHNIDQAREAYNSGIRSKITFT